MPSSPPAVLPSSEGNEIASAPSSVTAYPPVQEPRTIPIIMIDLRDIAGPSGQCAVAMMFCTTMPSRKRTAAAATIDATNSILFTIEGRSMAATTAAIDW